MIHPELLRRYRLFEGMRDEDVAAIAPLLQVIEVPKGELVFEQHRPNTGPYLVYSGRVKEDIASPNGREVITGLFGPGESFADIHLFLDFHGCRAVAIEESILYRLPRAEFIALMSERPRISIEYFRALTPSLTKLRFGFMNILLNDAERRLSTYLMSLVSPDAKQKGVQLHLPVKKAVLARYLGMTAETFSRTLGSLRESGCIRTKGRTVIVRSIAQLAARAAKF